MLYVLRDAFFVRLSIGSLEQSVCRPGTEENTKFITRSIWLVYLYLTHISILYLVSGSLSQQKSIFLPYTPSPSFPFHQGKSSTFGHIIKVKKNMFWLFLYYFCTNLKLPCIVSLSTKLITELILLRSLFKKQLIVAFLGTVLGMAILAGYFIPIFF